MYPPYQKSRAFKKKSSISNGSDLSIGSTWAVLNSTLFATSLRAKHGEEIEFSLRATAEPGSNEEIFFDFSVNGTRIGDSTNGLYIGPLILTRTTHFFKHTYTTQFADIGTDGLVDVDVWAKTSGSTRTLYYAAPPIQFKVKNIGPADDDDE